MLFEGCQGNAGVQVMEKLCPECGNMVEMMSTDVCAECDRCGYLLYNEMMSCVWTCPHAVECVGEEHYARLMERKRSEDAQMKEFEESDEW